MNFPTSKLRLLFLFLIGLGLTLSMMPLQQKVSAGQMPITTAHSSDHVSYPVGNTTEAGALIVVAARLRENDRVQSNIHHGLPDGQDPPFSSDSRYQFVSPITGEVYLRVLNYQATTYGAEVEYDLSVRALDEMPQHGALIIVAGKDKKKDPLQDNIYNVTNQVYQLFLSKGHPKDQIYYLAPTRHLDADGDGQNDVDNLVSANLLQAAITEWAAQYVGPERALTLFMMDHGNYDTVYLDLPRQEWVTAFELDSWLTELEEQTGVKSNIIIEACQSGSFIDLPFTVSKEGRVILTATGAYVPSYSSGDGALFSNALLAALAQDMSLKAAFDEGYWAAQEGSLLQIPWLDSDGNGIPNQLSDAPAAEQRGFANTGSFASTQWSPHIAQAEIRNFNDSQGTIWAEVLDDQQIRAVWAILYSPSYQPPESISEIVPEPNPIPLRKVRDVPYGAEYHIDYPLFNEAGEYRIVLYAEDNAGLISRPKEIRLQTGWSIYLPALSR